LDEIYAFAADLLGLSEVETNYCNNIGGGIAYEEVEKRIKAITDSGEVDDYELKYWLAQLTALDTIAAQLHVDVMSIPGSIGAGAISCFQLMPTSWLHYGGGDYREAYQAARNSARYLKAHGYFKDREAAILSYNFNAGQKYVKAVLTASLKWQKPVQTSLILWPVETNIVTVIMEFSEILAWYMNEYGISVGPVFIGDLAYPSPGAHPCGNGFGEVISATYTHWGVDLCGGSLKVYAMHDGRVVLSRFVGKSESIAYVKSDPGYISASGWVVVLEGVTEDGKTIQTIYGHLDPDSIPPKNATLKAGDFIAVAMCSGDPGEYCYGDHLHLGMKIDGDIEHNPLDYLAE
jgi:murein DD-endopeptidase MepM/ murein hydrolase activator NlpD